MSLGLFFLKKWRSLMIDFHHLLLCYKFPTIVFNFPGTNWVSWIAWKSWPTRSNCEYQRKHSLLKIQIMLKKKVLSESFCHLGCSWSAWSYWCSWKRGSTWNSWRSWTTRAPRRKRSTWSCWKPWRQGRPWRGWTYCESLIMLMITKC